MKNINKGTIARTIAVIAVLINQFLIMFGKEQLPFTEDEIYQGVSMVLTVGATLWAWWKNNSFTKEAIEADRYRENLLTDEKIEDNSKEEIELEEIN